MCVMCVTTNSFEFVCLCVYETKHEHVLNCAACVIEKEGGGGGRGWGSYAEDNEKPQTHQLWQCKLDMWESLFQRSLSTVGEWM